MAKEVELLSAAYRGEQRSRAARTPAQVAAYLAYRAPATFAAAAAVFRQVALQRPEWQPRSLLDVGAGPGVAAWAAVEQWPSLSELTLVEVEPAMIAAGRELLPDASWVEGDVAGARGPAELVVVVVRPRRARRTRRVAHLWAQAADTIVVRRAGHAGRLPARARRARGGDRGGRPHGRAVPARPPLPAAAGRLVPLRRPAPALEAAPAGEGRRARLRGREVLLRRAEPRAGAAGSGADHPAAAAPLRPRQPRHLRAATASTSARSAASRARSTRKHEAPPGAIHSPFRPEQTCPERTGGVRDESDTVSETSLTPFLDAWGDAIHV